MLERYDKVVSELERLAGRAEEFLADLEGRAGPLARDLRLAEHRAGLSGLAETLRKKRDVVLAVVGQIKTGKSTLLNALLFGEEILPVAASPKTARLTVIRAGEKDEARALFYTPGEWQAILDRAEAGDELHQEMVAEIRFQLSEEEIRELLGTTKSLSLAREELNEYVAEDGRYANLVKQVELRLNHPLLEGLTVVDTPGLDDPVEARERQTLDFLHQADAVLVVVSPSIRWLDARDLDLLLNQLAAGPLVHGAVLVAATRMDALDEAQRRQWEEMKAKSAPIVVERAKSRRLGEAVSKRLEQVFQPEAIAEVSALAHLIAQWRQGRWVPPVQRARSLEAYEEMIAERFGLRPSPEAYLELGGIQGLEERLEGVILARKTEILLGGATARIRGTLSEIQRALEAKRQTAESELASLEQGLEAYEGELRRQKEFQKRLQARSEALKVGVRRIQSKEEGDVHKYVDALLGPDTLRPPETTTGLASVLSPETIRRHLMAQAEERIAKAKKEFSNRAEGLEKQFRELLEDLDLGELSTQEADTVLHLKNEIALLFLEEVDRLRERLRELQSQDLAQEWIPEVPGFLSRLFGSGQEEYQQKAETYADEIRKELNRRLWSLYKAHLGRAADTAYARVRDWLDARSQEVKDKLRALSGDQAQQAAELERARQQALAVKALAEELPARLRPLEAALARLEQELPKQEESHEL